MGYVDDALAQAAGSSVDDLFGPARVAYARARTLGDALAALRSAGEREYAALVAEVAAGSVKPADVPARVAKCGAWQFDSPASMALVQAQAAAHRMAEEEARAAAPRVFKALQQHVASVVAQSVKLVASLPAGVADEKAAFQASRGGAKHFQTWMELRDLVDEWTAAHDLVVALQRAGWVPGPSHPGDIKPQLWTRYEFPKRLPRGYWEELPGELRLGHAKAAGAEPGLYGWDDAVERWRRGDRSRVDVTPMERLVPVS